MVADYGNRLFAAATLLCPSDQDAEELVFRTFEQALKKIRQFKPTGDFYKWLYTIMLNFRRMDVRRKRLDVISFGSTADLPEQPTEGLVNLIAASDAEAVRAAVQRLTEPLRIVMVLRYFELIGVCPQKRRSWLRRRRPRNQIRSCRSWRSLVSSESVSNELKQTNERKMNNDDETHCDCGDCRCGGCGDVRSGQAGGRQGCQVVFCDDFCYNITSLFK